MGASGAGPPRRETYRHGDLRRALVEAGTELARADGPDAVVLRETTRRVGVAPNAAYRHFADRDALLRAVCAVAQAHLARAMEPVIRDELAALPADADAGTAARARLRAVGAGYLRFALAEPGLFRTAFNAASDMGGATDPRSAGESGRTAFQLLEDALDAMVEAGVLPGERRPGAQFLAWSAVHGLSMLLLDGPLRGLDVPSADHLGRRLLRMVEQGL